MGAPQNITNTETNKETTNFDNNLFGIPYSHDFQGGRQTF